MIEQASRVPARLKGYRMPPEWAPHAATWLSWPHNRETWPDMFEHVEPAFCEIVAALAGHELVHINVLDARHGRHVESLLRGRVPPESFVLHAVPTNDAWIRDHGAIFVTASDREERCLALDFRYNAWGGKYPPYDLDDRVARQMGEAIGVPVESIDVVLEGGSIDVNGAGALLTTEQCLLNENRNPALTRPEIEDCLRSALGVREVVWLGDGIVGDDTDGHVDDLTRFVTDDAVVTAVESNRSDPNFAALAANRQRLNGVVLDGGRRLEVVELPMPEPQYHGSQRLPASYANFYVANEVVLLPVFGCRQDGAARSIVGDCFPGRRVVPIDCRALVAGLGALHCLTQQIPAIVDEAQIS